MPGSSAIPLTLSFVGPFGLLFTLIGWVGGVLAFLHILFRGDLRIGQKLLYIVLLIVPFWWLLYFILGKERTRKFLR